MSVRIIRVGASGPEDVSKAVLDELAALPIVYHPDLSQPSAQWLAESGVALKEVANGQVPDGAILILPDAGLNQEGFRVRRGDALEALVQVVDRLLGPGGCPWDQEQTHESLRRHLIEEAYEVVDAIDGKNPDMLVEELGDLLLQPLMHAQMEALKGGFSILEVAEGARNKLIRRHPHVFGGAEAKTSDEVLANWDRIKQQERGDATSSSILEGVPSGMPSLLRAFEVSIRAARTGFEWPSFESVLDKFEEEVSELAEAIDSGNGERIESEIGDVLFTIVNIARWLGVEPEGALRSMTQRFILRFQSMEARAQRPLRELSEQEWDELWNQSKALLESEAR
ncbi:MAG TPA: nucleoside triphosphate pyrophosphohydrolase [Fimbriimonadaceae bacterium]|uniref:Nucleoside triphosphate pyrophosphohydrolase n=1 Tax=Candidatus Nitrosymbiomonas proteolyticus TaxID=2608984 RepID=A0A809R936_9BACT|nr:nucleoside triphosphate pyrophosphohydrolase [Candidatus Nitrosymbiomonas proteolyticus]HQU18750.1 nucleoside triphosphate pyrophosphohydrolase [Fimbriimonadaceae bacterium]